MRSVRPSDLRPAPTRGSVATDRFVNKMFPQRQDSLGLPPVRQRSSSLLNWAVVVFLLVVQQGAFVSLPMVMTDIPLNELRDVQQNPLNTVCIAISLACIAILCLPYRRDIAALARMNKSSVLFLLLVLLSASWSIHSDLTIRRGIGYVLTILVAAYLTVRFTLVDRMKMLSASFAISASGSFIFTAICPGYGIMHEEGGLAGDWRGVFTTKEQMGEVMAAAVFTELFILLALKGRPRWRLATLSSFLALVVLSRSVTALLLSLAFMTCVGIYLLWQSDKVRAGHISAIATILVVAAFIFICIDPGTSLGLLGKDQSLTGRTPLWTAVITLIDQKPVLGWGYRAMFQSNDASTAVMDRVADFGASSSHNAFLEVTLELGLAGATSMVLVLLAGLGRAIWCYKAGLAILGGFTLVFIVGSLAAGLTVETLGQNQNIGWVLFNVLIFGCGLSQATIRYRETLGQRGSPNAAQ
jgi:exopolysaccharide production protein ExoQ